MCIGGIRFISFFKKIINIFSNDNRFILSFIGEGAESLYPFIYEQKINNVILKGRYEKSESSDFFYQADICNNLFGHGVPHLDYALSNRLYFALQFGMPILACPNTYTEEIILKYGVGFSFDESDPNVVDRLWRYYKNINWKSFYESCDLYLTEANKDEQEFLTKMGEFFQTS